MRDAKRDRLFPAGGLCVSGQKISPHFLLDRKYRHITMTIYYYTASGAPKAHRKSFRCRKLLPECGAGLLGKGILRHIFAVEGVQRERIAV